MTYSALAELIDLPVDDDPEAQCRLAQERRLELVADARACLNGEISAFMLRRRTVILMEVAAIDGFLEANGWPREPVGGAA